MEISLLDYKGTVNKSVDYRINEDRSGIYLKGFKLEAQDIADITGNIAADNEFLLMTVEDILHYKPWNYGNITKGAGQLGIYKLKDQNGEIYFALIKDYTAFEGDWRIQLMMLKSSEMQLKHELMTDPLGMVFADYIFGDKFKNKNI